jgi:hypothetical protein
MKEQDAAVVLTEMLSTEFASKDRAQPLTGLSGLLTSGFVI